MIARLPAQRVGLVSEPLDVVNYGRNKGYAGPANEKAARAYTSYIVIDTFARAAQEGDAQAAIEWGADQLERIYGE